MTSKPTQKQRKKQSKKASTTLASPLVQNALSTDLLQRFWPKRCTKSKAMLSLILDNHVSLTMPAKDPSRTILEYIAAGAAKPFPLDYVSREIAGVSRSRSRSVFGYTRDYIDKVALIHANMFWWITDKGLYMDTVEPQPIPSRLSDFDIFAGTQMAEHCKDGRLPKESLIMIAKTLDDRGFALGQNMQPRYWKVIADHNQQSRIRKIQSFEAAAQDTRFVRGVRRRLSDARRKWTDEQDRLKFGGSFGWK